MITVNYDIKFYSWWCVGTGTGQGRALDLATQKDEHGLPLMPGKTIKGLFRDALQTLEDHHPVLMNTISTSDILGKETDSNGGTENNEGVARFSDALITQKEWFVAAKRGRPYIRKLYRHISATALDDSGVTKNKQLRNLEVCLPITLQGTIELPQAEYETVELFTRAAGLIKKVGYRRHRGFGRCQVSITKVYSSLAGDKKEGLFTIQENGVRRCQLELELLEDCIVTAANTSQCRHYCLDYIPGSKLFGIAAGKLFAEPEFGADLFLSGRVRFGPGLFLSSQSGTPCFPVPLSYHTFKRSMSSDSLPLHNGIVPNELCIDEPLVQLRSGEIEAVSMLESKLYEPSKNRCLKSARNRDLFGVARENQLFNFESLGKGQKFLVTVEADKDVNEEDFQKIITTLLEPEHIYIGRSRLAEFGKARLTLQSSDKVSGSLQDIAERYFLDPSNTVDLENHCVFYLVSDLVLYRNNAATLLPFAEAFGLESNQAEFVSKMSFLRTRSYSPWNGFHRGPETERQVIVRGSVITFKLKQGQTLSKEQKKTLLGFLGRGIGCYRNEGLGVVLFNPSLVLHPPYSLKKETDEQPVNSNRPASNSDGDPLLDLIGDKVLEDNVMETGKNIGISWAGLWYDKMKKIIKSDGHVPGISQWASLRGFAVTARGNAQVLLGKMDKFTTHGRRTRFWSDDSTGQNLLCMITRSCTSEFPEITDLSKEKSMIFTLAIYHAASIIMKKLQDDKKSKQISDASNGEVSHARG